MTTFADLTTFRIGGSVANLISAATEEEVLHAANEADLLILGGGSNLLVSDEGYLGTVLKIETQGRDIESDACSGATINLAAGEPWASFVDFAVANGYAGVETLAGIPGSVGAAPIQNIGAYGSEIAESIARIRTYDRREKRIATFAAADCGFGYRTSKFKSAPNRWIVLDVTLQLRLASESNPIKYQELADVLGVKIGGRAPLTEVRDAVLALRRGKGMVLDPIDRDTWSAGSFFTNPVVDEGVAATLPIDVPKWPMPDGVKVSAAWLIERAGFPRGYRVGGAGISGKHSLALVNAENARAAEVIALAREIRGCVQEKFGILLEPEARLVGITLD